MQADQVADSLERADFDLSREAAAQLLGIARGGDSEDQLAGFEKQRPVAQLRYPDAMLVPGQRQGGGGGIGEPAQCRSDGA